MLSLVRRKSSRLDTKNSFIFDWLKFSHRLWVSFFFLISFKIIWPFWPLASSFSSWRDFKVPPHEKRRGRRPERPIFFIRYLTRNCGWPLKNNRAKIWIDQMYRTFCSINAILSVRRNLSERKRVPLFPVLWKNQTHKLMVSCGHLGISISKCSKRDVCEKQNWLTVSATLPCIFRPTSCYIFASSEFRICRTKFRSLYLLLRRNQEAVIIGLWNIAKFSDMSVTLGNYRKIIDMIFF